MDITIIEEKENQLISRKEVKAKIIFEGVTPARKDVQTELCKKVKAKENLFVVKTIHTVYGDTSAIVTAYAYTDEKVMKNIERQNLIEKHKGHDPKEAEEKAKAEEEAKKKAEEEAAAKEAKATPEEAPAEEKKTEEETKSE